MCCSTCCWFLVWLLHGWFGQSLTKCKTTTTEPETTRESLSRGGGQKPSFKCSLGVCGYSGWGCLDFSNWQKVAVVVVVVAATAAIGVVVGVVVVVVAFGCRRRRRRRRRRCCCMLYLYLLSLLLSSSSLSS